MVLLFVFISLIAILFVYKTYYKQLLGISPAFLFLVYYFIFRYIGDILLYTQYDRIEIVFYPFLGMMMTASGAIVFNLLNINKNILYADYKVNQKLLVVATFISVLSVIIYYLLSGDIPILHGFSVSDSDMNMHEARRRITYAHRSSETGYFGQGYFKFLFLTILPICGFYYFFHSQTIGKKGRAPWVLLAITIIAQILDSRLIPIGRFMIFFFLTKILVDWLYFNKFNVSKVLRSVVVLFALIFILFSLQSSQRRESSQINDAFLERLFLIPTGKLYVIFPDTKPFRHGSTWLNDLGGLLPGASENFRYEVHQIIYGGSHGFTLSPTFFGSIYVNFGLLGLIIFPFIFGYLFNAVGVKLIKYRSVFTIIVYCSYSTMIMYASVSDIITMVVPIMTAFLVLNFFRLKVRD